MDTKRFLLKYPSAWFPTVLSVAILVMLLTTLATVGIVDRQDEGVEAHLFQLWIVAELFLVPFFVVKWLPQNPPKHFLFLFYKSF